MITHSRKRFKTRIREGKPVSLELQEKRESLEYQKSSSTVTFPLHPGSLWFQGNTEGMTVDKEAINVLSTTPLSYGTLTVILQLQQCTWISKWPEHWVLVGRHRDYGQQFVALCLSLYGWVHVSADVSRVLGKHPNPRLTLRVKMESQKYQRWWPYRVETESLLKSYSVLKKLGLWYCLDSHVYGVKFLTSDSVNQSL